MTTCALQKVNWSVFLTSLDRHLDFIGTPVRQRKSIFMS